MERILKGKADLRLLPSACFWLFLAWLTLDILPFRLFRHFLQPQRKPVLEGRTDLIRSASWAVNFAARHVPWRAVCFHKGIAAQQILRRRGFSASLHYGVKSLPTGRLISHVWVTCDGIVVVGGERESSSFTELAAFHPAAAARKFGTGVL
jgi:Transglutaminase-like superfamily